MQDAQQSTKIILPDPVMFRAWVSKALKELRLSPQRLSLDLDLGRNTIGDFVAKPDRDIRLNNAALVHRHLSDAAVAKGVDLPEIGGQIDG